MEKKLIFQQKEIIFRLFCHFFFLLFISVNFILKSLKKKIHKHFLRLEINQQGHVQYRIFLITDEVLCLLMTKSQVAYHVGMGLFRTGLRGVLV